VATEPPWEAQQWPSQQWDAQQWPSQQGSAQSWPAETSQGQAGYADTFDGSQRRDSYQSGYQDQGEYQPQGGYQSYGTDQARQDYGAGQDQSYGAYQGPGSYQNSGGYQVQGGYGSAQGGYAGPQDGYGQNAYPAAQGGYGGAQEGFADGQAGYQDYANGYAELADGFDSPAGGYSDPRSSGPMLTAPDQPGWDELSRGGRDQKPARGAPGMLVGGLMGFLAAAVAIGIATLAAAFFRPQASPIIAVGEWFIDHTPSWLKNFAIQKFGQHDKTMLLLGMYVTIAFLAIGIGVLARRRITIGIVGVAVFGLFGAYIAYTRPASRFSDIIPSIIGGIAGVAALLWLGQAAELPELARAGSPRPRKRGGYQ
jgi:hypothetical protein